MIPRFCAGGAAIRDAHESRLIWSVFVVCMIVHRARPVNAASQGAAVEADRDAETAVERLERHGQQVRTLEREPRPPRGLGRSAVADAGRYRSTSMLMPARAEPARPPPAAPRRRREPPRSAERR